MPDVVATKFAELAKEIGGDRTPRQVAEGFLQIAVANMANAIKQVSVQKGHDVSRFALQCFGGAGGQHACLVADALGMETVFIHPYAGVLSAYGMGLADQTTMKEQAVEIPLAADTLPGPRSPGRQTGRRRRRRAGVARRPAAGRHHREIVASALRRHRSRADRSVDRFAGDPVRLHRRPPDPVRLCHAGAAGGGRSCRGRGDPARHGRGRDNPAGSRHRRRRT